MSVARGTEAGWPFWAPSDPHAVERALDLAGVREGVRFVDLGCGDGHVLVAAARRGANVRGIECDAELADEARVALAVEGLGGDVLVGDLFATDLRADVAFTYLAPATLQRLVPLLADAGVRRLVTLDFEVPGFAPDVVDGAAHLYEFPLRRCPPASAGWRSRGTLVVTVPDVESLTCLELVHPGGPVSARLGPTLADRVSVATGVDHAACDEAVAIDLRWAALPSGSLAYGVLEIEGAGPHALVALFSADDEESQWELSDEGAANLLGTVAGHTNGFTFADLLAAAEG